MRNLIIDAASFNSAQGFFDALKPFGPSLVVTDDGTYQVWISMDASNRRVIEALNAVENHVMERGSGPARLELDGRSYLLDSADAEPISYFPDDTEPAPEAA